MAKGAKLAGLGCLASFLALIVLCVVLAFVFSEDHTKIERPPDFIAANAEKVDERLAAIDARAKLRKDGVDYDPDRTVMALFSIEKALKEAKSFDELTEFIVREDSELVAPDVAKLKYRFFNIYKKMLDAEDRKEEMDSIYRMAAGVLLDLASAFDPAKVSLDHDQALEVWRRRAKREDLRDKAIARLGSHQDEIVDFYFDYMKTSGKYLKEWDKLCSVRDRAYLAVYEGDWNNAIQFATNAAVMAPHEREAHTLLAMALMERGQETDKGVAKGIVDELLENSDGQEATAYVLRGVAAVDRGDLDRAVLDFDQAAAYFPKQQERVGDKLNLYKRRQFLNKSKEGRMIINIYRGMMTGSGYFSPDFQKARIHLAAGGKDQATDKIFDHFFRRRRQGQWDRVLTDFKYCHDFLKTDLQGVFAGEDFDIELDEDLLTKFFSNKVALTIHNRGDKPIHNVTLLLCVRFTDMFKGDYVTFPIGETVSLLPAGDSIKVGKQDIGGITEDKLGAEKSFKDVIEYAAVLISDEVIAWVEPRGAKVVEVAEEPGGSVSASEIGATVKRLATDALDVIYESKEGDEAERETDKKVLKTGVNKLIDKAVEVKSEE